MFNWQEMLSNYVAIFTSKMESPVDRMNWGEKGENRPFFLQLHIFE